MLCQGTLLGIYIIALARAIILSKFVKNARKAPETPSIPSRLHQEPVSIKNGSWNPHIDRRPNYSNGTLQADQKT